MAGTGTEHVAGVEVDTRHWIGGERVASESTFDDVSPLDGQVIARVSRGGQAAKASKGYGFVASTSDYHHECAWNLAANCRGAQAG